MEKRSVYEYIKENINVNGKFSADASLREYVENQKKDSDLDLYNEDNLYIGKEKISFDFLFGEVDKIEFRLFSLFDKAIKESNFKELDKYLSESTFSVRKNLEEFRQKRDEYKKQLLQGKMSMEEYENWLRSHYKGGKKNGS